MTGRRRVLRPSGGVQGWHLLDPSEALYLVGLAEAS